MPTSGLSAEQRVRAAIEGRFLSMRSHGKQLGLNGASRVLATGGASQSKQILQVAAAPRRPRSKSSPLPSSPPALEGYQCKTSQHIP